MPDFKPVAPRFMPAPVQKSPDEKLHEVADMYEKHFLREMTKAMRSTVHESGFIKSNQAEKIFREQLDDNYVDKWSEKGGIGLSDMIYKQLVEKFGAKMGLKAPVEKPHGPLPMNHKSEFTPHQYTRPGNKDAVSLRFDKNLNKTTLDMNSDKDVKAPWDGVLLGKKSLGNEQNLVEISHDNGLKSQMVFRGNVSGISPGQKLQAGETLGFLSSEAKALYWTVEPGPENVSE